MLADLYERLRKLERKTSPFVNAVDANAPTHWCKPELVVQVRFTEWTRDSYLRHPAYLGIRLDKDAADVVAEKPANRMSAAQRVSVPIGDQTLSLSNLD